MEIKQIMFKEPQLYQFEEVSIPYLHRQALKVRVSLDPGTLSLGSKGWMLLHVHK